MILKWLYKKTTFKRQYIYIYIYIYLERERFRERERERERARDIYTAID